MPFRETRKRGEACRSVPQIKILLSLGNDRRRALKEALTAAAADEPGDPWRIQVASRIVYRTPTMGEWWLAVTLSRHQGDAVTLLVDPDHRLPAHVAAAVRAALRERRGPA